MTTRLRIGRNRESRGLSTFLSCPPCFRITIEPKYVNMADLNLRISDRFSRVDPPLREEPIWNIIELLFFAYRDFIGDPDDVLAKLGF